jgi:hypothetical protein
MKWRHNTDSNNGLHTTYYILGRLLPNTFLHTFQHATWQREKASNHTFAQLSKVELVERLTVAVLVLMLSPGSFDCYYYLTKLRDLQALYFKGQHQRAVSGYASCVKKHV